MESIPDEYSDHGEDYTGKVTASERPEHEGKVYIMAPEVRDYADSLDPSDPEADEEKEMSRAAVIAADTGQTISQVYGDIQHSAYNLFLELNKKIKSNHDDDFNKLLVDLVDDVRCLSPSAWRRFLSVEAKAKRRADLYGVADGEDARTQKKDQRTKPNYKRFVKIQLFEDPEVPVESRTLKLGAVELKELLDAAELSERERRMVLANLGIEINDRGEVKIVKPLGATQIASMEPRQEIISTEPFEKGKTLTRQRATIILRRAYVSIAKQIPNSH